VSSASGRRGPPVQVAHRLVGAGRRRVRREDDLAVAKLLAQPHPGRRTRTRLVESQYGRTHNRRLRRLDDPGPQRGGVDDRVDPIVEACRAGPQQAATEHDVHLVPQHPQPSQCRQRETCDLGGQPVDECSGG
jgi:hypothetical protein